MSFYTNGNGKKVSLIKILNYCLKNDIKSIYYIDSDGNTKKLKLRNGRIVGDSDFNINNDNLVCDFRVVDNKVINTINNENCLANCSIENNLFKFSEFKKTLTTVDSSNGYSVEICFKSNYDEGVYPLTVHDMRMGINAEAEPLAFRMYGNSIVGADLKLKRYESASNPDSSYIVKNGDFIYYGYSIDSNGRVISLMNQIVADSAKTYSGSTIDINSGYSTQPWIKYIRIYNRKLTSDDFSNNYDYYVLNGDIKSYEKEPFVYVSNGLKDFGSRVCYEKSNDNSVFNLLQSSKDVGTHTLNGVSYDITEFDSSNLNIASSTTYESLHFVNVPIKPLQVGDTYALRVLPHPFIISTTDKNNFLAEYSSNDTNTCACSQGVLFCKKAGSVTITAKLKNTNLSATCTINIIEKENAPNNIYNIPSSVFLKTNTPTQNLQLIFDQIDYAISNNYNYVKLPKNEKIKIAPTKYGNPSDPCYIIHDNLTIDLNGCSFYIQEGEYSWNLSDSGGSKGGYRIFSFQGKNSKVINGNFYGERYYNKTHSESEYTGYALIFTFRPDSERCNLENINFFSPTGMNIGIESNSYTYRDYGVLGGRITYDNIEFGKLDDEGNLVDSNSYLRTKDYVKLGYDKSMNPYYIVGMKGVRHSILSSCRYYCIYWYDENHKLLSVNKFQHYFEEFELPDGAYYYKLYTLGDTLPTQNFGEDSCVCRCFASREPKFHVIKNCNFINPHGGAINFTGGQRCIVDSCYINSTGAKPGMRWSIDFEDGFMTMRGNIICNSMIKGLCIHVSGNSTTYFSNYIDEIHLKDECELNLIINNDINKLNINDKEVSNVFYNTYNKLTDNESTYGIINYYNNNV